MFFVNFKIGRLKFAEKLFIFYLFCLFFSLIPAVKAKSLKDEIIKIINFPNYENNNGTMEFSCPSAEYTEEVVYTAFSSQIGAFIPIIGLLFTVAVYGTKSAFGYITTCHLDDIVIFTSSLAPIFAWYTVVKLLLLIFLYLSYMSPDSSSNNKDIIKMYKNLAGILVGLLVFVVIVLAIIKICFHKRRMKCFFHWLKTFIIWIYFFNSLEIILYSVSEQILFFPYIVRESIDKKNLVLNMTDLVFLNYLMNLLYFLSSFSLVLSYHFPILLKYLCMSSHKRRYQGFIRKKIFFFTISLSIAQLFFEYYFICTPPFVSTVFNTVITTVLTRSIASFFSKDGVIKFIHKYKEDNSICKEFNQKDGCKRDICRFQHVCLVCRLKSHGKSTCNNPTSKEVSQQPNKKDVDVEDVEERIFAKISPNDIGKVKNIYIESVDEKLEKYRVDSVKGYFYIYKKDKKDVPTECFYVMNDVFNDSVYLLKLKEIHPRKHVPLYKKILNILGCDEDKWEEGFLENIQTSIRFKQDCNMGNECEAFQKHQDIFIKKYYNKRNTIEDSKWIINDKTDAKAETNETIKSTTNNIDEAKEDPTDKISDEITKIEGFMLVNIIETGVLNYIIYSHRSSEKKQKKEKLYPEQV